MSRAWGCLPLIVVVVLASSDSSAQVSSLPTPGQAQPLPGAPARDSAVKPGTAILRGRVFAADSGEPLRKAQVRIFANGPAADGAAQNRATSTDGDGRYEFKALPAGRYNITAAKGNYIALSYGQKRPNEPGKPLEILDGQTVERVDFPLPRGGILTGRILDEFGDPAENVQVAPMQSRTLQGRAQVVAAGRISMTNDLGEFRIVGLPPGQYYLSATLRNPVMGNLESDDRSGYAPTYYPGTPSLNEAQRLTVAVGQTINDLTLTLVPTRTARVTGVALDSRGRPMTMGNVLVAPRNNNTGVGFMLTMGGLVQPDGRFTVSGLAPGDYTLTATMPGGFGDDAESATAQITVAGQDVNGVQLTAVKPSTLTGRIVIADAAAAQALQPGTIRLAATPKDPGMNIAGPGGPGRVNDDGTLAIKARPGVVRIVLAGPLAGWTLKAVRLNGIDLTDAGVEVKANEDVGDLEVELTNHLTNVSGLVTNSRGDAAHDYSVVIFSQDRERWSSPGRFFRIGRPDQDGRFKASGLPAGEYYAIAIDALDPNNAQNPEFLDRASNRAVRFSLNDAETKTLDLKLTTGL
jgi:carboxypeptidase family protein